jgi:hypothetical protein
MNIPEFDKAEYVQPQVSPRVLNGQVVEGYAGDQLAYATAYDSGTFLKALLFGLGAALLGSIGYALVGLSGFMVSIVALGIGWLVARAMMTATGGVGGRSYQIAAALMTYFACTFGDVWDVLIRVSRRGDLDLAHGWPRLLPFMAKLAFLGPFLDLANPLNGVLGLVILFVGLRTAWRMAAGSPGFGSGQQAPRVGPFGVR